MLARRFIKNDPEELAAYIRSLKRGLVVFDGRPGSGKTYLAVDIARRLGCKTADADRDFLDHDKGIFIGALRLDEMRRSLTTSLQTSSLVTFSSVCARQTIELTKMSVAAFIWVEVTSLVRVDLAEAHFHHDNNKDAISEHPLYAEVEAYISAYDARDRLDQVTYVNAYEGS